jgi:fatty acid desaturase
MHNWRIAHGRFEGEWENVLFPADQPEKAAPIIRWSRYVLIGHSLIYLLAVACGVLFNPVWFLVPVLTSYTPHYGTWLLFLCNNTQHIGLQDKVPDFRLCCRTFTVNPLVQFLYWHMNYHIEHHMYAAVPCYNLGKLHRAIKHELPPTPHGLIATWKEIAEIQRKQAADPTYQHVAPLPGRNTPAPELDGAAAQAT